eukprot:6577080-Karenia_brevis.AAC.1
MAMAFACYLCIRLRRDRGRGATNDRYTYPRNTKNNNSYPPSPALLLKSLHLIAFKAWNLVARFGIIFFQAMRKVGRAIPKACNQ